MQSKLLKECKFHLILNLYYFILFLGHPSVMDAREYVATQPPPRSSGLPKLRRQPSFRLTDSAARKNLMAAMGGFPASSGKFISYPY